MRGLALAGSVREPKGWEERCRAQFAVAATSEKSAAENETEVLETPVGQQLARAMRLFALTCFRRAGAESPTEWQYPLLQAKLLAKLRKSHTDVLAAFAKALRIHKENAAAARSRDSAKKGPQIDVQLGILTYLAKTTDLPMEGVQAGLALLGSSSSTCAPPNRDEAAKRILSELVSLRRQDGHQANKASGWLPGFKVIYRIARLQLVISSDPRLALSELNPLLSNRLLRPFFKAYFNPPGSILRTVQQILELQVDCIISSRSEDEALALLSRICRTAPERHAFAAQLWDPDHVFKRLYDFTFSSLRAQDGFGTELVPVSPGMSTAFGKKLTRPHFERCAPQIEQSLSRLLAKEPADPLLHRRLGILAKLAELVRCRDVWHSGVSWLVVDTEEDSEVERMGVALYAWMWRSINADGAFDPPDEEKKKDKDGEKEKERSEVKLRFKVVSKRIATFLKSVDKFLPEELREGTEVKKRGRRKTMDPAQLETKREAGEPTEDKGEPTEEATLAEPSDPPSRADMTADGIENGGAAMDVDRHGEGPVDSPAPEEEIEEQ